MKGRAHHATLRLAMADAAAADRAARSLAADNGDFVSARAEGAILVLDAQSDKLSGLMRSLDDCFDALRAAGFL